MLKRSLVVAGIEIYSATKVLIPLGGKKMLQLPEITDLPCGARFFRADLHIHSSAGSHDVKDTTATPEAIVTTGATEGLKIIAITDHNEIAGVAPALAAANATDIFVVPGIESFFAPGDI